jgi:hypothetical protein
VRQTHELASVCKLPKHTSVRKHCEHSSGLSEYEDILTMSNDKGKEAEAASLHGSNAGDES